MIQSSKSFCFKAMHISSGYVAFMVWVGYMDRLMFSKDLVQMNPCRPLLLSVDRRKRNMSCFLTSLSKLTTGTCLLVYFGNKFKIIAHRWRVLFFNYSLPLCSTNTYSSFLLLKNVLLNYL